MCIRDSTIVLLGDNLGFTLSYKGPLGDNLGFFPLIPRTTRRSPLSSKGLLDMFFSSKGLLTDSPGFLNPSKGLETTRFPLSPKAIRTYNPGFFNPSKGLETTRFPSHPKQSGQTTRVFSTHPKETTPRFPLSSKALRTYNPGFLNPSKGSETTRFPLSSKALRTNNPGFWNTLWGKERVVTYTTVDIQWPTVRLALCCFCSCHETKPGTRVYINVHGRIAWVSRFGLAVRR